MKIDRGFIDLVLGKTESRMEMELSVVKALGLSNYPDKVTSKEFEIIRNVSYLILSRDMRIIELSAKECLKHSQNTKNQREKKK